ncbi:hypothetical protein AAE02nite_05870 [Adhaeribacter aerolatus]|uniref:Glycine zipper domain-containing protein n=2 Tax=Adhaeribacter aerolatus TaxID=670289 RepID=A0A512ATA5_9BACT|nr:hypothetical protein AAE02nite_05870 [Adhaeribacter aerolatus]
MNLNPAGMNNQQLAVKDIAGIKLRKGHAVTSGGVLGGLSGLLLGGIIGSIAYQPCDATPGFLGLSECSFTIIDQTGATLIGAGLGVLTGSGIGILIGHRSKNFQISGSQRLYEQNKGKLAAYLPKVN